MTTGDKIYLPEATELMTAFLQELDSFPLNQKLQPIVDSYCQQKNTSRQAFLYSICFLTVGSKLTPYEIFQETKIPLKTIKLLINNLNNALRKFDQLGAKYVELLFTAYPDMLEDDASTIIQVNQFFQSGFELVEKKA